jgi:tetratricopeptide (TPR) repeat protein
METTKLIEDYLDNNLSDEERSAVEARAATDKSFNELINLHREINESIRDKELVSLNQLLTKVGNDYKDSQSGSDIWKNFLRLAAVFLILAGSAAIIRFALINRNPDERLFRKYYKMYSFDAVSRSAGLNDMQLESAVISYNSGQYNDAFSKLGVITDKDKGNYTAWFCRGLVSMEIGNFDEAIRSFKMIPDTWHNLFAEHRSWYLALALLKQGNSVEASEVFKKIRDAHGHYSAAAEEILIRLSS